MFQTQKKIAICHWIKFINNFCTIFSILKLFVLCILLNLGCYCLLRFSTQQYCLWKNYPLNVLSIVILSLYARKCDENRCMLQERFKNYKHKTVIIFRRFFIIITIICRKLEIRIGLHQRVRLRCHAWFHWEVCPVTYGLKPLFRDTYFFPSNWLVVPIVDNTYKFCRNWTLITPSSTLATVVASDIEI